MIKIEKIKVNNSETEYFRFGSGEKTLVILPGLSARRVTLSAEAVARRYALFDKDFCVYLPERVSDPPARYTVADMAKDAAGAFDALGLENACVFGASQGGMIALTLAVTRPDLVGKLALGSSCAKADGHARSVLTRWTALARSGDGEALCLDFGRAVYPEKVYENARSALAALGKTLTEKELARFSALAEATADYDVTAELGGIRCPVLSLRAADDAVLKAAYLDGVPQLESFTYPPGYGHAVYDTAPDFPERLYGFFK